MVNCVHCTRAFIFFWGGGGIIFHIKRNKNPNTPVSEEIPKFWELYFNNLIFFYNGSFTHEHIWNIVLHLGEERRQWINYLNVLFVILSHNFMVNPCKAGFGPDKIEKKLDLVDSYM